MFNSIAPRYDLLNHLLSANVDRFWWRSTARRFRTILADPDAAILDICCGTGDMTMALTEASAQERPAYSRRGLCARHARPAAAHKFFGRGRCGIWRPTLCICRCAPGRWT